MEQFSQETAKALGYYVYALIDPRGKAADPRRLFYVGKGKGNRCFHHARAEIKWKHKTGDPNPKLNRIRDIRRAKGTPPLIEIIRHGFKSQDEAHHLEAILIKLLQTEANLVGGKYGNEYCLPTQEVEGRYSSPILEQDLKHSILLVSLRGTKTSPVPLPDISKRDLPHRTLGDWPINPQNASHVEYVVGVFDQLIGCVFKTKTNQDGRTKFRHFYSSLKGNGNPNWKVRFSGSRSPEMELQWGNRRIVTAKGETLTKFPWPRGSRLVGPVKKS